MSNPRWSARPALALAAMVVVSARAPLLAQTWTHTDYAIPAANAQPQGIAAGPDGNLWFTEYATQKIGRLTPTGVFTEFPVAGNPTTIASGPDGNLWFHLSPGQIGRMSPTGSYVAYPKGDSLHSPGQIAAGPDGNVWFTVFCDDAVYRITPTGTVTRFPVPTAGACAYGITAGPDGNVWFTEHYGNKIGRITPAGSVTEFRIGPVDTGYPDEITAGSDGNLWATDNSGELHSVTTDGAIRDSGVGAFFGHITSGGGFLWTNATSPPFAQILRVRPFFGLVAGTAVFPLLDSDHGAVAVAYGSDGAVWFPEGATNNIGRIAISPGYFTVAPCRAWDTRSPGQQPLSAGTSFFGLVGLCGIPPTATAVALNVTVIHAGADGHLTLDTSGASVETSSTINYGAGQTRANNAIVPIAPGDGVQVHCVQGPGQTHFALDVVGFFQDPPR
jgi:streptogramin lyase